jgi:hypothetical protein
LPISNMRDDALQLQELKLVPSRPLPELDSSAQRHLAQ